MISRKFSVILHSIVDICTWQDENGIILKSMENAYNSVRFYSHRIILGYMCIYLYTYPTYTSRMKHTWEKKKNKQTKITSKHVHEWKVTVKGIKDIQNKIAERRQTPGLSFPIRTCILLLLTAMILASKFRLTCATVQERHRVLCTEHTKYYKRWAPTRCCVGFSWHEAISMANGSYILCSIHCMYGMPI